ncbi:4-phytase, partial [Oscillochloris sp. ZM17-4]|uniref:adenylate/guanylate cyclase domain-containing protein n=1 Tax=Oscillochloris sp. ZM17-4 TaxID=2866714 RepID=UPI00272DD988
MKTLVVQLAAFLPRDRAAQIALGAPLAAEGVAMIGDISGFTPLTETLARELSPARGGEELTRALNGVFAPLIGEVHRYGGSVIKFAGDALIVWFPRPPRARRDVVVRRALAAAAGMQAAIARHGQARTPAGPFTLTMKVGLAYGPALRVRLGDPLLGYEDVIGGETLDR